MKPQFLLKDESGHYVRDFRNLLEFLAAKIKTAGISVIPYHSPELIHFSKLPVFRQQQVMEDAYNYLESLQDEGETQSSASFKPLVSGDLDFRQSLWLALKYFGLRPTSDLFDNLSPGRAVEVYNSEGIQIWRNFRFFEVCGYSIEEMFSYTWQERYERNDFATQQIIKVISQFSRETPKTVHCNIFNQLKETFSQQRFVIDVIHECLSPVYDQYNNVAGFVAVSNANVISSQAALELGR